MPSRRTGWQCGAEVHAPLDEQVVLARPAREFRVGDRASARLDGAGDRRPPHPAPGRDDEPCVRNFLLVTEDEPARSVIEPAASPRTKSAPTLSSSGSRATCKRSA
jgi:hypothetical protein